MPTAQEYFQRVFDRYPVAWDEGPFLYRQLNFARNQVALDCDVVKKLVVPADTNVISLTRPFLAVRKIYYKKSDADFSYELKYKATAFSPFSKWSNLPTNFYLIYPNQIQILPVNFTTNANDYFEIYYVPKCQDMSSLADVEADLPEQLSELVVLQVCMRLAENDLQYAVKQYFENEYKLQLLKVPKASYLYG
jgi:hypothetical protein